MKLITLQTLLELLEHHKIYTYNRENNFYSIGIYTPHETNKKLSNFNRVIKV